MRFVRRQAHAGVTLVDPLAEVLADVGRTTTGATSDVDAFLRLDAVFAPLWVAAVTASSTVMRIWRTAVVMQ